jgi:hypothetical protein
MCTLIKTPSSIALTIIAMILALDSLGQKSSSDTTFLVKEKYDNTYHAIFIDTSKTSKFYDEISDFKFGQFDQESYDYSLEFLKSKNLKLTETKIEDLPRKWIILKLHGGQYFTYKPSDFYSHYKVDITDSSLTEYTGEGPVANKITTYFRTNDNAVSFRLSGVNGVNRNLTIYIIDKKKGIAVFENRLKNNLTHYLMIDATKIRELPIIVNYCETQKQVEFEFEKPDYKKLIGMK